MASSRDKRKNPAVWRVPGYTLESYLDSGAYCHAFRARDIVGSERVIKIYDLSTDAVEDLKSMARQRLGRKPSGKDIEEQLRLVLAQESMEALRMQLDPEEEAHVLLPDAFVNGVKSRGIFGVRTVASVNKPLKRIIGDEIEAGYYSSYDMFVPLIRDVVESLAVFHKERKDPITGKKVRRAHNDIKPQNIGIDWHNSVRLFDCGMARTYSSQEMVYNNVCALQIRAPELKPVGDTPSPRSDIWQIGCLMYCLAAGKPAIKLASRPRKGEPGRMEYEGKLDEKVDRELEEARTLLGDTPISPTFARIMWKCLEKDPQKRYAHAEELLAEFEANMEQVYAEFISEIEMTRREKEHREKEEYEMITSSLQKRFGIYSFNMKAHPNATLTLIPVNSEMMGSFSGSRMVDFNHSGLWFMCKTRGGTTSITRKFDDVLPDRKGDHYVGVAGSGLEEMRELYMFSRAYEVPLLFSALRKRLSQFYVSERVILQGGFLEVSAAMRRLSHEPPEKPEDMEIFLGDPEAKITRKDGRKMAKHMIENGGFKDLQIYMGWLSYNIDDMFFKVRGGIIDATAEITLQNVLAMSNLRRGQPVVITRAGTNIHARASADEYYHNLTDPDIRTYFKF